MKVDEFRKLIKSGDIKIEGGEMRTSAAYRAILNRGRGNNSASVKTKRQVKPREDYITQETIKHMESYFESHGCIFIPYNVVSSKNSKQITTKGDRPRLIHSKAYRKYRKLSKPYWIKNKRLFKELTKKFKKPIKLCFYFIRFSNDNFDHINMMQGPQDLMQEFEWIVDDGARFIEVRSDGFCKNPQMQGLVIRPVKRWSDAKKNIYKILQQDG